MALVDSSKTRSRHGTGYFYKRSIGAAGTGDWNLLFVPTQFAPVNCVDLIVYFHGFDQPNVVSYFDDAKRDGIWGAIESSGRSNLVLVAPSMGNGKLVETNVSKLESADGFSEYIRHVLKVLAEVRPTAPQRPPGPAGPREDDLVVLPPTVRNLVLAGHSGGGRPLLVVSNLAHGFAPAHLESWCFDGFYYGSAGWISWLNHNLGKTLRGFHTHSGNKTDITARQIYAPATGSPPANADIAPDPAGPGDGPHDGEPHRLFGNLLTACGALGK